MGHKNKQKGKDKDHSDVSAEPTISKEAYQKALYELRVELVEL